MYESMLKSDCTYALHVWRWANEEGSDGLFI